MPEQTPITFRVAGYIVAGVVSVASFFAWMDARIDNRITERLVPIEHRLTVIESTINTSDASRNRQYGELLKRLEDIRDGR